MDIIINDVLEALPDIKLMIMEPFVLRGSVTEEKWTEFRFGVEQIADAAKQIASRHNIKFIPLMKKFDDMAAAVSPTYWTADGIHPTAAGCELIKREWIKAFKEFTR